MGSGRHWIFTINNPKFSLKNVYELMKNELGVRYVIGQKEKGKEGTEHLQFYAYFQEKRAFSSIQTVLPGAHIEIANNPIACIEYCTKEDTRIEDPESFGIKP